MLECAPGATACAVRRIAVVAVLCLASRATAQSPTLGVFRGRMLDSAGRAVAGVNVRLNGAARAAVSDSAGLFVFDNVPTGELTLAISHPRFVTLTLSIPGAVRDTSAVPVLLLTLASAFADEPADRMAFGRITDIMGAPIRDVELTFLSTGLTTRSDALGWYGASLASRDTQSVRLRKIGYAPQTLTLRPGKEGALRVDVTLGQLTVQLAQTVVHGSRKVPRLRQFFSRMEHFTDGQFLIRPQIDPLRFNHVTDLLARMRGVHVGYNERARPVPQTGAACTMRVVLNGMEIDLDYDSLNGAVRVRDLVGVEVYNATTRLPIEFQFGFTGSSANVGCGVIALWTL